MMNDPVTMRRKLRVELKRLRTARDLTQRHVAERLDWSQSKVIRIENGSVAVGVTDLEALLRLYGVAEQETIDSLVEMARGSKRLPFTDYKDVLPQETLRFFAYESSASIIRQVTPTVVPGLLQTEEYARALLASSGVDGPQIDQIWAARLEHRELLESPGADDPDVLYPEGQMGDYVFRDEEDITGQYLRAFFTFEGSRRRTVTSTQHRPFFYADSLDGDCPANCQRERNKDHHDPDQRIAGGRSNLQIARRFRRAPRSRSASQEPTCGGGRPLAKDNRPPTPQARPLTSQEKAACLPYRLDHRNPRPSPRVMMDGLS